MHKIILIAFLWWASQANAQLQPLKIGDTVPALTFHMVNYSSPETKLSDFRGKLVILDFWSIWCGSCIHAMPGLQQLQAQYGDKVMILPVCFSFTREQVQEFFDKRKGTAREISLPSAVCEDFNNDIYNLFPTKFFPHEIWIDSSSVLRAITESAYVTAGNIRQMLTSGNAVLPGHVSQLSFDPAKPLFIANNGGNDSSFLYRSMIAGFIDSIYGSARQHNSQFTRLFIANADITSLVKMSLFHRISDIYNKQVVWEVTDRSRYLRPAYDSNFIAHMQQTAHCYELILPPTFSLEEAYGVMHADICRFFNISATIKQQPVDCWVLRKTVTGKLFTKGGTPLYKEENDYTKAILQNRPVSDLVSFLSKPQTPLLLDETGYAGNIDLMIDMGDKQYDLPSLNVKLAPFGLVLKEAVRNVNMLVITEHK